MFLRAHAHICRSVCAIVFESGIYAGRQQNCDRDIVFERRAIAEKMSS